MEDHAIGTLHLPVRLWVCHSRPVHTYVEAVAERQEFLACELGAVVGDDRIRDPEPKDDVGEEQNRLLGFDLADVSSLDPLGEFVDRHQQVGEAPGRLLQWTDEVQSPHGKRPRDGDGLQSMGREMSFSSVELATLAGPHDVGGVGDRGEPVKSLPKYVTHEGARRGVMTAGASMDVTDQLLALGDGDASLQDARGTALVQLVVDWGEGLGPPSEAPCLSAVRG